MTTTTGKRDSQMTPETTGNGNVSKASMLEYVNEYVGGEFRELVAAMNRQFDEIKTTLVEMRADFVTKEMLAASFAASAADREKLWAALHDLQNGTVKKEVHDIKCGEVQILGKRVTELEKVVWKAAGAAGIVAAVVTFLADKLFG